MCKRVLFVVLFFLRLITIGKPYPLRVDSTFTSNDSCLVFATTRSVNIKGHEFAFENEIAKDGTVRFYNIYFNKNELKIAPRRTLEEAMDNANISPDFMIYTEGHGKLFSDNVARSINISRVYTVSVIMFDWPSKVPGLSVEKNFHTSVRNAKSVAKQFNDLLLQLTDYKKNSGEEKIGHLSMFFHSMGNFVLLNTLKKYGSSHYDRDLIDNIIVNAPCVPSRGHDKILEQSTFQKNIYVMYNKKDPALKGATYLLGRFILGSRPMHHLAKNARYVDMKEVARVSHNCFLGKAVLSEHPEIKDIYADLFHSRPLDLNAICIENVGKANNYCVL